MSQKVHLGTVGHFGIAVPNPKASARWWQHAFDLEVIFEDEDVVGLTNDDVTIVLQSGTASPQTIGHVSFHVADMPTLYNALGSLKALGVEVEDPGDEVGPEAPGSKNMGVWFHDPDGYRWELSVQAG